VRDRRCRRNGRKEKSQQQGQGPDMSHEGPMKRRRKEKTEIKIGERQKPKTQLKNGHKKNWTWEQVAGNWVICRKKKLHGGTGEERLGSQRKNEFSEVGRRWAMRTGKKDNASGHNPNPPVRKQEGKDAAGDKKRTETRKGPRPTNEGTKTHRSSGAESCTNNPNNQSVGGSPNQP